MSPKEGIGPILTVVDYGMGNLFSVQRALEHCGAAVEITSDPQKILTADKLILPGVGAFADGMKELSRRELVNPLRQYAASGRPFLGICLGMQLMLSVGEEFGIHEGLNLVPGRVIKIPPPGIDGPSYKVPHTGWNELWPQASLSWEKTILHDFTPGESVYFVHSFMVALDRLEDRLAFARYGGHEITAVLRSGNIFGCQFHPEKSATAGLKILRAFVSG